MSKVVRHRYTIFSFSFRLGGRFSFLHQLYSINYGGLKDPLIMPNQLMKMTDLKLWTIWPFQRLSICWMLSFPPIRWELMRIWRKYRHKIGTPPVFGLCWDPFDQLGLAQLYKFFYSNLIVFPFNHHAWKRRKYVLILQGLGVGPGSTTEIWPCRKNARKSFFL